MRNCLLLIAGCGLALAGCGGVEVPETGNVTGTVTIDGKPAAGVRVKFSPVGPGRGSSATTDASGNYSLIYSANATGAMIGQHKATIAPAEMSVDASDSGTKGKKVEDTSIPTKYLSIAKEVEVKAGDNKIDLAFP